MNRSQSAQTDDDSSAAAWCTWLRIRVRVHPAACVRLSFVVRACFKLHEKQQPQLSLNAFFAPFFPLEQPGRSSVSLSLVGRTILHVFVQCAQESVRMRDMSRLQSHVGALFHLLSTLFFWRFQAGPLDRAPAKRG